MTNDTALHSGCNSPVSTSPSPSGTFSSKVNVETGSESCSPLPERGSHGGGEGVVSSVMQGPDCTSKRWSCGDVFYERSECDDGSLGLKFGCLGPEKYSYTFTRLRGDQKGPITLRMSGSTHTGDQLWLTHLNYLRFHTLRCYSQHTDPTNTMIFVFLATGRHPSLGVEEMIRRYLDHEANGSGDRDCLTQGGLLMIPLLSSFSVSPFVEFLADRVPQDFDDLL